jgi:hypothetical protein
MVVEAASSGRSAGHPRALGYEEGTRGRLCHLRNQRLLQPTSGHESDLHGSVRNTLDVFNDYGMQIMNK